MASDITDDGIRLIIHRGSAPLAESMKHDLESIMVEPQINFSLT
jgi:hypothetical protein